jgi:hypothetical protein
MVPVQQAPQALQIPATSDRPSVNKRRSREREAMVAVQATDTDRDYIQTRLFVFVHCCFFHTARFYIIFISPFII